ncbi:MAG: GNAT family N-acetyltransferase [Acholeplasmataceae bacterium]
MNILKNMPVKYFDHYMLRTLQKNDAIDMYDYGKDLEVTKFLTWGPMTSLKDAKLSIKSVFFQRPKNGIPIGYAIIDINCNKMIGTIDFHTKIKGQNAYEVGYVIHKDYWGLGIMTKALEIVTEVGFEVYGYDKLLIKHLKNNLASGRVIEKNRYIFKSSYPYVYKKVTHVLSSDMMVYEMTKERYNEIKSR